MNESCDQCEQPAIVLVDDQPPNPYDPKADTRRRLCDKHYRGYERKQKREEGKMTR